LEQFETPRQAAGFDYGQQPVKSSPFFAGAWGHPDPEAQLPCPSLLWPADPAKEHALSPGMMMLQVLFIENPSKPQAQSGHKITPRV